MSINLFWSSFMFLLPFSPTTNIYYHTHSLDLSLYKLEKSCNVLECMHFLMGHTLYLTLEDLLGLESCCRSRSNERSCGGRSWEESVSCKSTTSGRSITALSGKVGSSLQTGVAKQSAGKEDSGFNISSFIKICPYAPIIVFRILFLPRQCP